ncbi:hypothetical protein, partial [Bifidobacterium longum]
VKYRSTALRRSSIENMRTPIRTPKRPTFRPHPLPNYDKSQTIFAVNSCCPTFKSFMVQESRSMSLRQCILFHLCYIHGSPFAEK